MILKTTSNHPLVKLNLKKKVFILCSFDFFKKYNEFQIDNFITKAKQLLKFEEDETIKFVDVNLNYLIQHPKVADSKIVVFSIIGAFRKGKSFFMNYCLRYLYANYPSIRRSYHYDLNTENWMGDRNDPLVGFSWRDGLYRDTTGIVIWDDVFLHTNVDGKSIAIIVIDTHGLFDNETTPLNNSKIFALGTLLSSIQVFNISNVIQEDQLQYLQYTIEFANYSSSQAENNREKIFQKLIFLLRDWSNDEDYDYGFDGGVKYLKYILESNKDAEDKLRSACQDISNSFEILTCFLLPSPGDRLRIQRKSETVYNGNWGEMNLRFRTELFKLINEILKPDNLKVKKIDGRELNGLEFLKYTERCFKIFESDKLPETPSIHQAAIETHMRKLVESCFDEYRQNFDMFAQFNRENVADKHYDLKSQALQKYNKSIKMGDEKVVGMFLGKLEYTINEHFKSWCIRVENNKRKIEISTESLQKKLEEQHKEQLKIKMELKKESKEKYELEQKKKKDYEVERIKKFKQIPSLLIDIKIEEAFRISLEDEIDIGVGQLQKLLENSRVSSCKIVPISIVGGLKRKSNYIFNYCLRYLYAHYKSLSYPENTILDSDNWRAQRGEALEDIPIKSKLNLDSSGILFWNDVFFHTTNDENIAIILFDTHAIYAYNIPSLDALKVLELGTLISSFQFFQLDYANQAIDLAIMCAQQKPKSKPFQNIGIFVNKSATSINISPCKEILMQHLAKIIGNEQIDYFATSLYESFQSFKFYELYFSDVESKGISEDDMEEQQKSMMFSFIISSLEPQNLKTKTYNGKDLTGIEYFEYVKKCLHQFKSHNLLVNLSNIDTVVDKYLSKSVESCFASYQHKIEDEIENQDELKKQACENFERLYEGGAVLQVKRFKEILVNRIDEYYKTYIKLVIPRSNENKELKKKNEELQQQHEHIIEEKNSIIKHIEESYKKQLEKKYLEIEKLKTDLSVYSKNLKEVQNSNSIVIDRNQKLTKDLEDSMFKLLIEKKNHKDKIQQLERKNEIDKAQSLENINNLIEDLKNILEERKQLQSENSELNNKIYKLQSENSELSRKTESNKKKYEFEINCLEKQIENLLEDLQIETKKYQEDTTQLEKDLKDANKQIQNLTDKMEKKSTQKATSSRELSTNQLVINERVGKFGGIEKNISIKVFLDLMIKATKLKEKDIASVVIIYVVSNECERYYDMFVTFKDEKIPKAILNSRSKHEEQCKIPIDTGYVFFTQAKNMTKNVESIIFPDKANKCFQFKTADCSMVKCFKYIDKEDLMKVECICITTQLSYIAFFDEDIAKKYFNRFRLYNFIPFYSNIYLKL